MTLSTPISQITSVGKRVAPSLKKLGLETARDLLFYWPFRYEDWSQTKPIGELVPGDRVTIRGTIEHIQNKNPQWVKRLVTEAVIADESGSVNVVWFHQPYITRTLKPGDEVYISGSVEVREHGMQFSHPLYEKVSPRKKTPTHTARIVPIYSLTKRVTQKQLRYMISQVLPLAQDVRDWLPGGLLEEHDLLPLNDALAGVHFPETMEHAEVSQQRLKYNELLLINLRAQRSKLKSAQSRSVSVVFKEPETKAFVDTLPFKLTNAQRKASWEIVRDLEKTRPMNRLLEGDVGSGKTVVAALALLNTMLSKFQAAYMAPTEILATQQYEDFIELFKQYPIHITLLTGSTVRSNKPEHNKLTKKKLYSLISGGEVDLVIGTHALIQKDVLFKQLALAIIDEQHRFGVSQRAEITKASGNGMQPHFLSMTATPIPRSLALTVYGDLDMSVIDELPKNRKPIKTKLVPPDKRGEYYTFIKNQIQQGRQVFVICPLVDPSDTLGKKAATEEYQKLDQQIFPELRIGLVHGRMKPQEKNKVMQQFADHELDILVATSVIEVGINIPNATVMLIESAERFGLAQLHQFRGRVGRGEHQSYCLLFSESTSKESLTRLQALVDSSDGFALAEHDLEFRGPGEVYGVKQHGYDDVLTIAKLTDYQIIKQVQKSVAAILHTSIDLQKFPLLEDQLNKFEQSIHFE